MVCLLHDVVIVANNLRIDWGRTLADISTLSTLPTHPTDTTIDPTNDVTAEQDSILETQDTPSPDDDFEFEELDEELIIEDFTIDGICGVY
jgi:mycofactocin precursor